MSQWKGIVSICTAYLPYRYVERWGGCADECHEIVIWQASPRCGINSLSHLSLMSWTDIYRVTRCVLGRSGVTAAGIYALRLLKAGCASSAVGSLRPLCDGFQALFFHIDIISPPAVPCYHPMSSWLCGSLSQSYALQTASPEIWRISVLTYILITAILPSCNSSRQGCPSTAICIGIALTRCRRNGLIQAGSIAHSALK